jgi:hypothetical protein
MQTSCEPGNDGHGKESENGQVLELNESSPFVQKEDKKSEERSHERKEAQGRGELIRVFPSDRKNGESAKCCENVSDHDSIENMRTFNLDRLVKSREIPFPVIPAEAGIRAPGSRRDLHIDYRWTPVFTGVTTFY